MAEATTVIITLSVVLITLILAVAALVMPLYVIAIHSQVKRIREILEEM